MQRSNVLFFFYLSLLLIFQDNLWVASLQLEFDFDIDQFEYKLCVADFQNPGLVGETIWENGYNRYLNIDSFDSDEANIGKIYKFFSIQFYIFY